MTNLKLTFSLYVERIVRTRYYSLKRGNNCSKLSTSIIFHKDLFVILKDDQS